MTQKKDRKENKLKKVPFSFKLPQASEVLLVGDFNQWNGKKHKMEKNNGGAWEKTLMLSPGTYEYKYIVDGKWQEDPTNYRVLLNTFGTFNNLLTVKE